MSTYTTDVQVHPSLGHKKRRPSPYLVRWRIAGKDKSKSFKKQKEASSFRAALTTAALAGQKFDQMSGLPVEDAKLANIPTVLEFAKYVVLRDWDALAAKSNQGLVQGLATVLPAFCTANDLQKSLPGKSNDPRKLLEKALQTYLSPKDARPKTHICRATDEKVAEDAAAEELLRRLDKTSLLITEVTSVHVQAALLRAEKKLDGTPAAASTYKRKRSALSKIFTDAVHGGLIPQSPFAGVSKPRTVRQSTITPLDPIEVGDAATVETILSHVENPVFKLALQIMYYAGLRPSEVAGLQVADCELPKDGRAVLNLRRANTETPARWSSDGETREARELKHRAPGDIRRIPIPAVLTALLKEATANRNADELVVCTSSGRPLSSSNVARGYRKARAAWVEAEEFAGKPRPSDRQLPTPYSLRHACATLWLAVMPPVEVARRLGNSVDVLFRTYANVLPELGEEYNSRLDAMLNAG